MDMVGRPTDCDIVSEPNRILQSVIAENLNLELMVAVVLRVRCPNSTPLFIKNNRPVTDSDSASSSKDLRKISPFFQKLGYFHDKSATFLSECGSQLKLCHLRGRLYGR